MNAPYELQVADVTLPPVAKTRRPGTQSLGRGIKLMRMIATRPKFGWRLSDLAVACGEDRGTVHRMLACLVEERLVEQRSADRRYLPGPLMYELGLARPAQALYQECVDSAVERFARRMKGIALFMLRSGAEYVCTTRSGSLVLSGLMIDKGSRKPLFTSVGGVAILQTLPIQEQQEILTLNVQQETLVRGPDRLASLQKMRERSDRHGFGVNLGDVVPGIHSFAVPVCDSHGQAFGALCLMGTPQLYREEHINDVRAELTAVIDDLQRSVQKFNM